MLLKPLGIGFIKKQVLRVSFELPLSPSFQRDCVAIDFCVISKRSEKSWFQEIQHVKIPHGACPEPDSSVATLLQNDRAKGSE